MHLHTDVCVQFKANNFKIAKIHNNKDNKNIGKQTQTHTHTNKGRDKPSLNVEFLSLLCLRLRRLWRRRTVVAVAVSSTAPLGRPPSAPLAEPRNRMLGILTLSDLRTILVQVINKIKNTHEATTTKNFSHWARQPCTRQAFGYWGCVVRREQWQQRRQRLRRWRRCPISISYVVSAFASRLSVHVCRRCVR